MKLIKNMPLDTAALFDGASYVFKVLDSMKEYDKFCQSHKIEKNIEEAFQTAVRTANVYISRISRENYILDRPIWRDNLEFFWQPGFRKRKHFIQLVYVILSELQIKIDEISQTIDSDSNDVHKSKVGFFRN